MYFKNIIKWLPKSITVICLKNPSCWIFFILCKCSLNIIGSWIYEHSRIICLYQKFYLWGNPFKTLDHYSWYKFHHKVHWMKFIRLLIQAILLNDVCLYFNMTLAWNKGTEIYLQNEHINLWFFGRDFSMFKMFFVCKNYIDIWKYLGCILILAAGLIQIKEVF